ncbi:MAG TPA: YeeE/YedE family protein [Casimicrobiaceae bacterium]
MIALCAFLSGLVFGIGLIVSQMVNPAKVLGFLDIAGRWDPSLALVMAGAVAVGLVAFGWARKRSTTLLATPMRLPQVTSLDQRLVGGSLLFGIGWGLAGFCPGPAVVALGAGHAKALVFVLAMLGGMVSFELLERMRLPSQKVAHAEPAARSE